MTADWLRLLDHLMLMPERVYEGWNSREGYDNNTPFGVQFGENRVPWCVIHNWCIYEDVHLQGCVPKVDNVSVFSAWAKARGQWSEYPSVGAWVNFGAGQHTEIVTGFDATTVRTKGGNSVKAGATDAGQGNGVWSHVTERRSARVTGYFAPHYPDKICPPTADPKDARGGKAITSYVWVPTKAPAPPFPGRGLFGPGANNQYVTMLGKQLVAKHFGSHYTQGPGPKWGEADRQNVAAFQRSVAALRGDADGLPGPLTWQILFS